MLKNFVIAALGLLTTTAAALAWDDQGHMMVAAIAYDRLTPATKARVAQLLALNQYPTNGRNNAGAAEQDKAAFMMAATAPDAIKHHTGYIDDGEDPTNAPEPDRNSGFDDPFMHKYWHYIDLPFSPDGTGLVRPPTINAQERIHLSRQTLASNASDELKAFDLIWLLHLVADVHQPLHATSRFTADADPTKGDRGGNAVKVCAPSCHGELHAFWDDVLGTQETVTVAIAAARHLPMPDSSQAKISDEVQWIQESFDAAQQEVYVDPVGVGNGPYTLDATYRTHAKKIAKERAALAGVRLANLLNQELN
jgi:hypothetical protein